MSERLTISAFARKAGCDEKQVRRAIEKGLISKGGDGLLDAALVDGNWRKPNRRTIVRPASDNLGKLRTTATVRTSGAVARRGKTVRGSETPAEAAERIVKEEGLLPLDQALKLKENYLGRLKQLEYDLKAGTVVIAADTAKAVGAEYARVRTRLLAIPSERAPAVHRLKTVPEVEDLLRSVIVEALGELTLDGESAPG